MDYLDDFEIIQFRDFVETWRTAWQNQDVDNYMNYYDKTFQNDQMNFKKWYSHKRSLKSLYSFIKVQLGSPIIFQNKDQVVIRVLQKYQSNLHTDYGQKTIHARFSPEFGFKIIREDWIPIETKGDAQVQAGFKEPAKLPQTN